MILISFFFLATLRILSLSIKDHEMYKNSYDSIKNVYISGPAAPRGRILDRNGVVLVDNRGTNTVIYNRTNGSSEGREVEISYKLGSILKFSTNLFTDMKLKKFYLLTHSKGEDLISEEEKQLYRERKLTKDEIEALKLDRVGEEELASMSFEDKNASHIYSILSKGFYYEDKIVMKDLTDEEVVQINDMEIPGVRVELVWERTYPYGNTLKTILGSISNTVPIEYKDYYENKGIDSNSTVGTSFLEFQYDEYLRGVNSLYKMEGGKLKLVEEEKEGMDLYLSIDINKQLEVEKILKEEMLSAKKYGSSKFYNHSFVIVGSPKTGEILAVSGLQLIKDHFNDITANIINSSYTVGSIVKGATISVGYKEGLIKMGTTVRDACLKVYGVTEKCSWTSLGYVDDVRALAQSSNYYQFLIAAKLANPNYRWNSKLGATSENFQTYRDMLKSYGLGNITGIDLPNERLGIIGKTVSDDLLLNLAIGQYDTYTPIEVFQYINTIANDGNRLAPSLMLKIVQNGEVVLDNKKEVLNSIELDNAYIKRIQEGFRQVMVSGTGKYYVDSGRSAAGKTGTSETFVDSNGDGRVDTKTISTSFIMYAPVEEPKYSVIIISPNLSTGGAKHALNLRVNKKIVNYLFENS